MIKNGALIELRYRVDRMIGEGANGEVYAARDLVLERDVAIKMQFPRFMETTGEYADYGENIADEFLTSRMLSDIPGVVPAIDSGTHQGRRFFVMEIVQGGSLAKLIEDNKPMSSDTAIAVVAQLCEILDRVHSRNFVHRDVKPDNVMVKRDGEICVLDLGLATHLDHPDNCHVGTPGYIAPEQREGGTVTERSDIFSLGCILFEMMIMTLPYPHETGFALEQTAPFDSALLDTMNPRLRDLGLAMIAWHPFDRPARMSDILDTLRPVLPGPTTKRPARATEPDPALWYWKYRRWS